MAQHKFNFRLITRDDSTAVACDAWLEDWNLEGRRMSEARDFRRSGGPGSSSSRRGAGRERSAAVVEHRGILGAEYWVTLAEMEDWQRDRRGRDTSH